MGAPQSPRRGDGSERGKSLVTCLVQSVRLGLGVGTEYRVKLRLDKPAKLYIHSTDQMMPRPGARMVIYSWRINVQNDQKGTSVYYYLP